MQREKLPELMPKKMNAYICLQTIFCQLFKWKVTKKINNFCYLLCVFLWFNEA